MTPKKSPKRPSKRTRSHMSDPTSEAEMTPKKPKKRSKRRSKKSRGHMSEYAAERWMAVCREWSKRPDVMQEIAETERKREAEAALLDEESQALKRDACATSRMEKEKDVAEQRFMASIRRWEVEEEKGKEERREEGLEERQEEGLKEGQGGAQEEGQDEGKAEGHEEGKAEGQEEGKAEGQEEGKEAQHQTTLEELNKREEKLGWLSRNRSDSIDGGDSMECHAAFEPRKKRKRGSRHGGDGFINIHEAAKTEQET